MRQIKINVPTGRVDEVKDGLLALGVERIRIAEIAGYVVGRETEVV